MNSRIASFLLAALCAIVTLDAWAATRGVTVTLRADESTGAASAGAVKLYGASHALVIGIDRYRHWPRLKNAVEDANAIANELRAQGFDVTLKKDLDGDALARQLKAFFAIKGRDPEARLLLWFAGHGHTINGEGFLVPADAPLAHDPMFKVTALHMRDFGGLMRLAESKHVLSVFDSCFSGTIFEARAGAAPAAITKKTTQPVRQFLTSGDAGQEVRDDGSFREYFIRALRGEGRADVNADGYVTGDELGLFMSQRMAALTGAAQTPKSGKLHDVKFNRGDFVFVLPGTAAPPPAASGPAAEPGDATFELAFWNSIKDSRNPTDYRAYLETYPNGKFAALARARGGATQQAALRPPPKAAPPEGIDLDAEARRIRRGLTEFLEISNARLGPDFQFRSAGPMTVLAHAGEVLVEFRDAHVVMDGRTRFMLGNPRFAITPREDGLLDFAATLPKHIDVRVESEGALRPVGFLATDGFTLAGTWSTDLTDFTGLNLAIRNLRLVEKKRDRTRTLLTAQSFTAERDFQKTGRHSWSGPERIALTGLHFTPAPSVTFELAELAIERQVDAMDMKLWNAIGITSQLTPLLTVMRGEQIRLPGFLLSQRDWGKMTLDARLAGFRASERDSGVFSLDDAEATITIDGAGTYATVDVHLVVGEMIANLPDTNLMPELFPRRAVAEVRIERIPLRAILGKFLEVMTGPPEQLRPVEEDVFALVRKAEPVLSLDHLVYETAIASVMASGSARTNEMHQIPFLGDLDARIEGLDGLIREIAPRAANNYDYREFMEFLVDLREYAERDGSADQFHFEVSPKGELLINGRQFPPKPPK
jgi:hypothetical protein